MDDVANDDVLIDVGINVVVLLVLEVLDLLQDANLTKGFFLVLLNLQVLGVILK